jgi:TRAP-type C4-dicarboxylate transport system substrate-binding protein
MAKEALTEAQLARRRAMRLKAKAAAVAEGKVWKELPQEERRKFMQAARQAARQARQARKAAE